MQIRRIFNEIFSIGGTGSERISPSSGTRNADGKFDKDLELLYAYIEAELDGEDAASQFPQVHAAIQSAKEASEQYEDLKEILQSERDGTLLIPEHIPNFDFSYLKSGKKEESWRWDRGMGQLFVELSEALINSCRQTPPTSRNLRSSNSSDEIFRMTISPPDEDLSTKLIAKSIKSDDSRCDVFVQVERPSLAGAPLMAQSRVDLILPIPSFGPNKSDAPPDQDKERVVQYTNAFGEAIFRQISILDLPHLQFSIEPAPRP